jgi:hypothetical protein
VVGTALRDRLEQLDWIPPRLNRHAVREAGELERGLAILLPLPFDLGGALGAVAELAGGQGWPIARVAASDDVGLIGICERGGPLQGLGAGVAVRLPRWQAVVWRNGARCGRHPGVRGTAVALAAAAGLLGLAAPAAAQDVLSDCAAGTPPALVFDGLPTKVVIGSLEPFGFAENDESQAEAPGSIKVRMVDRRGRAFYTGTLDPNARGDDLLYLRIDLGNRRVKIIASFVERSADGTQCKRVIAQRVREVRRIYFPSRCTNPGIRPSSVIIACGDGNFQLRVMHWRGWHRTATSGRGRALANDCIPNCAAGTFHRIGIKVRLTKPRLCKNIAQYVYGRIAWRFSSSPPGGGRRSGSVGFPCSFYDEF